MKGITRLLLAGAAGIVSISAANAADLPTKAKAAEYVKVCSAYGAGFYYIPGTDTCIKIGGWIRAEYNFNAAGSNLVNLSGASARDNRAEKSGYSSRVRSELSFDTRTQTEYGTLRSYIRFGPEINSDATGYTGQYTGYRGTIYFSRAFIQFAGFTFGKTQSFFDFYNGTLSYTTPYYAGSSTPVGQTVFAYTAELGGGLSATLAAEDGVARRIGLVYSQVAGSPTGGPTLSQNGSGTSGVETNGAPYFGFYRNNQYPDVVANLRLDQPWGSAQINGAIHDVSGGCNGACAGTTNGLPNSFGNAVGYAIGGGVKFNLPFAPGDVLWLQATYADGAISYLGPYKPNATNSVAVTRGVAGSGTFTTAAMTDGVIDASGKVQKTTGYQFSVAAEHYWAPNLRTSAFGGYLRLDYNKEAAAGLCNAYALQKAKTAGCNPDFGMLQVGTRTIWSPVANLELGAEIVYTRVDQKNTGDWTNISAGSSGSGTFKAADAGIWHGIVRVQRNFWP
ncbi:porin omp2b precursor [Variibacter gotjawalensis]|uniref:Porin n=1 Tax=Variibacter gotjawalensis TaxID=1333996 RepID=A0A0S3PQS5_9BRAD|nr:porin [Variibacter gotjawalensis]NIK48580.1 hypothetical protein [Variibacter gotjawalensis]RZS50445.1 porin-like protein [Variibacter gotjawalensis]BAT58279.1 porin omp2b precursor [Variibacter gotjawalensis]